MPQRGLRRSRHWPNAAPQWSGYGFRNANPVSACRVIIATSVREIELQPSDLHPFRSSD